jgi:hypothetical protein
MTAHEATIACHEISGAASLASASVHHLCILVELRRSDLLLGFSMILSTRRVRKLLRLVPGPAALCGDCLKIESCPRLASIRARIREICLEIDDGLARMERMRSRLSSFTRYQAVAYRAAAAELADLADDMDLMADSALAAQLTQARAEVDAGQMVTLEELGL